MKRTFFYSGMPKGKVLKAFKPHIFFDDQIVHCDSAEEHGVVAGRVPWVGDQNA